MKFLFHYLFNAIKYFLIQSLAETILIVVIMYLGLPYSGMLVGDESLWEVIIGILGYYTMPKLYMFGLIYLFLFVVISAYKSYSRQLAFSILNVVLNLCLFILFLGLSYYYDNGTINGLLKMLNVFISIVISSTLIVITTDILEKKKNKISSQ